LDRLLSYDPYRLASFLDHVLDSEVTPEAFARREYQELGSFVTAPYQPTLPRVRRRVAVALACEGTVAVDGRLRPLWIKKQLSLATRAPELVALYRLHNPGAERLEVRFGVETVWAVTDPASVIQIDGRSAPAREPQVADRVQAVDFTDWGWPAAATLRVPAAEVWLHPLETVSNSEAGFERIFQGVVCLCLWTISLQPHERWEATLQCTLA